MTPALPPLIALHGSAGSGKSVVARHLKFEHKFQVVKFAGPLKAALRAILAEAGEDNVSIEEMIEGKLKESRVAVLGMSTPRRAMQTLGTEWGRDCMDSYFWVRLAANKISRLRRAGIPVVVDDMRFDNELAAIRKMGGFAVEIVRPQYTHEMYAEDPSHVSETALKGLDARLSNDAFLSDLRTKVDHMLENLPDERQATLPI